jgi:outer membrane protein
MQQKKTIIRTVAAAALAACAFGAQAQTAGTWWGSVGATRIAPDVSSGTLSAPSSPNTQIDVGADTQLTFAVGRMLTDHWGVEVPIGFGFKHEVTGAGSINGVGRIATIHALPISVFAQYRFLEPTSRWRPYVMLGLTYAHFYDEKGSATLNAINPANPPGGSTGLKVDDRFGIAPGLGVVFWVNERWYVDASYAKTFLKTTTTLSTGQKIDAKLDPDVWRLSVGMKF